MLEVHSPGCSEGIRATAPVAYSRVDRHAYLSPPFRSSSILKLIWNHWMFTFILFHLISITMAPRNPIHIIPSCKKSTFPNPWMNRSGRQTRDRADRVISVFQLKFFTKGDLHFVIR